jgi:hypothetical protein
MKPVTTVTLAALLSLPAALVASERAVQKRDVPAAVQEAVQKKYGSAKVTGFERDDEKGKTEYEAKLDNGVEVSLTAEGKILSEESTIDPSALPDAVKKGLQASKYGSWKVQKAEKVIEGEDAGKPSYEVEVTKGAEKAEVVFDPAGTVIKEEVATPRAPHKK